MYNTLWLLVGIFFGGYLSYCGISITNTPIKFMVLVTLLILSNVLGRLQGF